eukprot:TRINITY_DN16199_c0_g1_i2.p2 TRINITY_DN16199_c0_g1~~TRINITY_DN16199_c0_g1_i2.p2  ORF type:complete len:256 (+),score=55.07 TRINITY_DN16199_c0_g1_i2:180-947(+)
MPPTPYSQAQGEGLVVHRGQGEWDAPTMPHYLYHLMMRGVGEGAVRHQKNRIKSTIDSHARDTLYGAEGLDRRYRDTVKKVGLTQGMFTWSCPMAKSTDDVAEVDENWERLTQAFLSDTLGKNVDAVIIRGPFDAWKVKPKVDWGPGRTRREEYKFHVLTPDFDDHSTLNQVHYNLRQLKLSSMEGYWMDYAPIFQNYLQWYVHPMYMCPPTGGAIMDKREAELWNSAQGKNKCANNLARFASGGHTLHTRVVAP